MKKEKLRAQKKEKEIVRIFFFPVKKEKGGEIESSEAEKISPFV